MDCAISLKMVYNSQPSSKGVSAGGKLLSSVTLWMVKDSFKRRSYLVNTFFLDTLLDVTIFFYSKWIKKE